MDKEMRQSKDYKFIPMTSLRDRLGEEVTEDVFYYTDQIANIIFIGLEQSKEWFLIDAGMPYGASEIIETAQKRFGMGSRPLAIMLTHGHFDHVGGLIELIDTWQVPVYAHPLEAPFLTGKQDYPKPDHTVEGGMLAKISAIYPHESLDIGDALKPLPENGEVPYLSEWRWIHTPGHAPGHVSFFRERDGLLIAGDAFVTVKQDSFYNVLMQRAEVNGPPVYLTTDWQKAKQSVEQLAQLPIEIAITGHGPAMHGEDLREGLNQLVHQFDEKAIPSYGKFIDRNKDELEH